MEAAMTTGEKISILRKNNNYTQEQLADILGVSRQAISKWESGSAYPETDKLIRISELFNCSLDYLLKQSETKTSKAESGEPELVTLKKTLFSERKSSKTLWGLPLWHIGKNAKGIIAVGVNAKGVIAVGVKAVGVISIGVLSLGMFTYGALALGLISLGFISVGAVSAGCFAIGLMAAGAVSLGVISTGAVAVGDFSIGALAVGKYFAYGSASRGMIAIGEKSASGSLFEHVGDLSDISFDPKLVKSILDENVPVYLNWAKNIIEWFIA